MFPRSTLMATQRMNLTYLTLLDIWLVFKTAITITVTVTNNIIIRIIIRYIVNLVLISVVLLLIIVVAVNILKSILICTVTRLDPSIF